MGTITRSFANLITASGPSAVADGSITTADITGNVNFRNIVINGDMSIAQRGTSKANVGFEYGTMDRWQTVNGSLGTWTQSQSTDVPTGQGFAKSLKMDCTTADATPAAGDEIYIRQLIEGQNLQYLKKGTVNAASTTVSFWVKSTKTGTFIVEIVDNDNGQSLNLNFWIATGSDASSGTLQTTWGSSVTANRAVGQVNCADSDTNDWYITGVQLEAGTTASDFEFLPIDVSLNRCYRYYYKRISTDGYGPLAQGMQIGASDMMIQGYHPITMRTSPTMAIGGTWNYEAGTSSGAWSIGSQRTNPTAWATQTTVSNTDGSAAIIYASDDTTANLTASAEL